MNDLLERLPGITGIFQEKFELETSFEEIASAFGSDPGTVVLLSGTDLDCARYHILAARPWLSLTGTGDRLKVCIQGDDFEKRCDSLDFIETVLDRLELADRKIDLPVGAGLFGYFSYELKNRIEKLPRTCVGRDLPDIRLYAPSIIVVADKQKSMITLCIPMIQKKAGDDSAYPAGSNSGIESPKERCRRIRDIFYHRIASKASFKPFRITGQGVRSNFVKEDYLDAVKTVIEYIKAGDIYQANLSQRFEAGCKGDPYGLFLELFKRNPAPFFAFVQAGDHQVVSTSPERFIHWDGTRIETRPIKGTIRRGEDGPEDERLGRELLNSTKDDAELSMIVDLMRNDLGRVARGGSVAVKEHKRLEPYDNVFHLVSIVEAELDKDKSCVDLIRATFPGGSITGCPKIRSMEIIDELETHKRHIYTGSIGYLSFHNTMDLSIAIRTATVMDTTICFSVGGGIVYDSDPEKEYMETLYKGKTLLEALGVPEDNQKIREKTAWVNGRMLPEKRAVVSATSPGFQYGAGLFETIRIEKGIPRHLEEHVKRFNSGWQTLFKEQPPDITWKDVIHRLVLENRLDQGSAAAKLLAAVGDPGEESGGLFVAAFARPYVHRLEAIQKKGLDLITYPFPRQTPLADFKSLNYLFYYLALSYCKEHSADEALILNPDGTVSETNTCNIMAVNGKKILLPVSDHVLSGVTLKVVLERLSEAGYAVMEKRVHPEDFFSFGPVILTNSLMGAVPVVSWDTRPLKSSESLSAFINSLLDSTLSN